MLMQEQLKQGALVIENNKALDVVSGITLGIASAYIPFTLAMGAARLLHFTSGGDALTVQSAALVGLSTVLIALPLAYEARRSPRAIAITSSIVFCVLGFITSLTF